MANVDIKVDPGLGRGWLSLVNRANVLCATAPFPVKLSLKEKLGALRINLTVDKDPSLDKEHAALKALLSQLSDESTSICEGCGAPARQLTLKMRRPNGLLLVWVKTMCYSCYEKSALEPGHIPGFSEDMRCDESEL